MKIKMESNNIKMINKISNKIKKNKNKNISKICSKNNKCMINYKLICKTKNKLTMKNNN